MILVSVVCVCSYLCNVIRWAESCTFVVVVVGCVCVIAVALAVVMQFGATRCTQHTLQTIRVVHTHIDKANWHRLQQYKYLWLLEIRVIWLLCGRWWFVVDEQFMFQNIYESHCMYGAQYVRYFRTLQHRTMDTTHHTILLFNSFWERFQFWMNCEWPQRSGQPNNISNIIAKHLRAIDAIDWFIAELFQPARERNNFWWWCGGGMCRLHNFLPF